MSFNQSRVEGQLRRPGRPGSSNSQRSFAGAAGKGGGGGGGGSALPPSHSVSSAPSLSTNRSFKKPGNGQAGQSRGGFASGNAEANTTVAANRPMQNGTHVQSQAHGASVAQVPVAAKPIDSAVSRSPRSLPKAPTSQPTSIAPDSAVPITPLKGDASKAFPLQFGTISPGFMNGMQIPARTTSAPPNLDEQKQDQACHVSIKAAPTAPITPAHYKQQPARKDVGGINQANMVPSQPSLQAKRDVVHIPAATSAATTQRSSVLPMTGMPMPLPYPPQVPIQFGGPGPQISSQGATTPLQMPMPLPVGNGAQVQQPVFVSGLPSHPLQAQGIMPQGQNLGFASQMGHQLVPQMGNLNIGMPSQFAQPQAGKFGTPRKAVRITDPLTHKELRLDKKTESRWDITSSVQRSHPNVSSQSQPIPSFSSAHPISCYSAVQPNSYSSSVFFQSQISLPLTGSQITPSTSSSRYNYHVGQGGQTISILNAPLNPSTVIKPGAPVHGISEPINMERAHDRYGMPVSAPSTSVQVTVKPPVSSLAEKGSSHSMLVNPSDAKCESSQLSRKSDEAGACHQESGDEIVLESRLLSKAASESSENIAPSDVVRNSITSCNAASSASMILVPVASIAEHACAVTDSDSRSKEFFGRSDSFKDQPKKANKNESHHSRQQTDTSGSVKTTGLESSEDNISSHMNDPQVSQNSKNMQGPLEAFELSDAAKQMTSPSLEWNIYKAEVPKADERKEMMPTFEASGVILDIATELPEDIQPSCCSSSQTEIDGIHSEHKQANPSEPKKDASMSDILGAAYYTNQDSLLEKEEIQGIGEMKSKMGSGSEQDRKNYREHTGSTISESIVGSEQKVSQATEISNVHEINVADVPGCAESELRNANMEVGCISDTDRTKDNLICLATATYAEAVTSMHASSMEANANDSLLANASKDDGEMRTSNQEACENGSALLHRTSVSFVSMQKVEGRNGYDMGSDTVSTSYSTSEDRISLEQNRAKSAGKKKKKRELLPKKDAAGTNSDLYTAYRAPEEKPEIAIARDIAGNTPDVKKVYVDTSEKDGAVTEDDAWNELETDDWEDAAEISSPKLRTLEIGGKIDGTRKLDHEYDSGNTDKKKYSKDFLLTFREQCTNLPMGLDFRSKIVDALMIGPAASIYPVEHESQSGGRILDRPIGGARADDKWNKALGVFASAHDPRVDGSYSGFVMTFRPGQDSSHGVLRNPRGQLSSQYVGGILAGPMHSLTSPGGLPRNGSDTDRWQRAHGIQKGLIPSPQTPFQVMHKAEKKYEVGKVTDEEAAKQRQLKAILNKLTPQNFEKLFQQAKEVNIDNATTLTGVISQIFDKALTEPTFCEMYANFCFRLAGELPDLSEENEKITFKRKLLNKCQEEFESGEREQAEANKAEEEGEIKQSEGQREEKKLKARRRMLGNIRLIGELYKKKMLTENIMHLCIGKLLGQNQDPDEEDVEALCKLMSTIGEMIDHPKAKSYMDSYFDRMRVLSNNQKLSSRLRFMLRDAIDLRKNKWQQRRKIEGPKKIEEVHRDAAQERQLQGSRLSRGPTTVPGRRGAIDYGARGSSLLSSPGSQNSGVRTLQPSLRGGYMPAQDARLDDRHPFESRTVSVPLPQRSTNDVSISFGPQGGLARGMSIRGQPPVSTVSLADASPTKGDHSRFVSNSNDYSSASEMAPYNSQEDLMPRHVPERHEAAPAYDRSSTQDRNASFGSRNLRNDHHDGSMSASPTIGRVQGPSSTAHTVPSELNMSEDRLRDLSIAAIREFYSARNEEEVRLCIQDLRSPGFYPDMVMLWVTDSFEKKDADRDLLAKLLVNLCKSGDSLLSHVQLIRGLESVFSSLEDAITDYPKAAQYLGSILGKVVAENVIQLTEIGRLMRESGEEPLCLESGVAADVFMSIFETIKREKGDTGLNEIRMNSNLRLEDFQPPDPVKSRKLAAFI